MGKTKYIFISGGVSSSLGAGVVTASIGKLLQASGFTVALQKLDPYINVNSGMLNPYEHGEVFVTADGHEGDIDLGTYERFLNAEMNRNTSVSAGRIFQNVIKKEREGAYLGHTVQMVPNITNEIKQHIYRMSANDKMDFVIVEIGGTVGDIESLPFVEAERQVKSEVGRSNFLSIHMTLVPFLAAAKELKTKPTQHSVKQMLELGIQPDMLVLRTEHPLTDRTRAKVGLFCNVQPEAVFELVDQPTVYDIPVVLNQANIIDVIMDKFGMEPNMKADLTSWQKFTSILHKAVRSVRIALVGKYVELPDAYKSILAALTIASAHKDYQLQLSFIQAETLNAENVETKLEGYDGILLAPGFGPRGVSGKVVAARYAREKNVPMFGIGMGMQCAVIEFARNVADMSAADSTEYDPSTVQPVFNMMADQKSAAGFDDTMRLGAFKTTLEKGTKVASIYGQTEIEERHRHRFEFDTNYRQKLEEAGLVFSGMNDDLGFVDVVEYPKHAWYVCTLFQPEFKTSVQRPHPLFLSFVEAAIAAHGAE